MLKTWFELSGVKLYRNNLKGNKNYFEVSGRFELSRVRVIGSPLYSHKVSILFQVSIFKEIIYNNIKVLNIINVTLNPRSKC